MLHIKTNRKYEVFTKSIFNNNDDDDSNKFMISEDVMN
jgi:hypothetical protein